MARHDFDQARAALLRTLRREFAATADLTGCAALAPEVAAALDAVPREAFVLPQDRASAYADHPLAIGAGQTISQPFIVALMTQLAALTGVERVLEVGTGSGYQAAVLARLAARVHSVEIIAELATRAAATLARLGVRNVDVRCGDGQLGWPEHAPYDAILVTAGGALPLALAAQLAVGGRLVIPEDAGPDTQVLRLYVKQADGTLAGRDVLAVRFVPLTGA